MSAPPPAPGPTTCPACHAPVAAGARFCAACGASLAPAPPAAAGAPPVDIRSVVDADRGVLKRLQMLIPGFRGYREGEDIREADSLLRLQVADRVHRSAAAIQGWRTALTNQGQFASLTSLADALADLQRLEGEIRHAEQGYTGISPAVRLRPEQLDRLYEYDYGFAAAANDLWATAGPIATLAPGADAAGLLVKIQTQVKALDQAFRARRDAVEGIRVG